MKLLNRLPVDAPLPDELPFGYRHVTDCQTLGNDMDPFAAERRAGFPCSLKGAVELNEEDIEQPLPQDGPIQYEQYSGEEDSH